MTPDAVADMVQDAVRAKADVSLLNLAAKAHGNPFLVSELVGGLGEEGRLTVNGGRAVATGERCRAGWASVCSSDSTCSPGASEVVRVAAVLPDRFSAGLLAAMLDRQPVSLMSALEEAVRAELFVEDGERLRFRHDLLREATRTVVAAVAAAGDGAPVCVGHARDGRGPGRGGHPAGAQRRTRRPGGDRCTAPSRTVGWPQRCECGRGLEQARVGPVARPTMLSTGHWSPKRWSGSTGPAATARPKNWPLWRSRRRPRPKKRPRFVSGSPAHTKHSTQRRVEENRRALQLRDISEVTRARHLAWLAYNLMYDQRGQQRAAADEAAAAAAATGDLEATNPGRCHPGSVSTAGTGTRAARYAASRRLARSPARVM